MSVSVSIDSNATAAETSSRAYDESGNREPNGHSGIVDRPQNRKDGPAGRTQTTRLRAGYHVPFFGQEGRVRFERDGRHGFAGIGGAADAVDPVVDHVGDAATPCGFQAEPEEVGLLNLREPRRPDSDGQQRAVAFVAHAVERENRASLFDPAQMPTTSPRQSGLRLCVEDVDLPLGNPPRRAGVIEGQRPIPRRRRRLGDRREDFLEVHRVFLMKFVKERSLAHPDRGEFISLRFSSGESMSLGCASSPCAGPTTTSPPFAATQPSRREARERWGFHSLLPT